MLVFIAWDASPQEPAAENPLQRAVRACAALSNDSERLACYDRTAERLVLGVAEEAQPSSPEDMFGAGRKLRHETGPANPAKREPLTEITARAAALREGKDGLVLIELDNGQVWKQSNVNTVLLLRAGDTVTISRGALGTFRLAAPNGRFAQVRRVR
jgi:hypothetical protein